MKTKTTSAQLDLLALDDLDPDTLALDDLLDLDSDAPADDLLALDDDDLLSLEDDELSWQRQRTFDILPVSVKAQESFCRAGLEVAARKRAEDPLDMGETEEFEFWWDKYRRDGNKVALAQAYLLKHASLRAEKPASLQYKRVVSDFFPGVALRTEIVKIDDEGWHLLIRMPEGGGRLKSNINGNAHKNFRMAVFAPDPKRPGYLLERDKAECFQAVYPVPPGLKLA